MEEMHFTEIPRVREITREAFLRDYVRPQKPVVIERMTSGWPAFEKWSLDYIREVAGEKEVPLYDGRPISAKFRFNEPHLKMKMREYISLLEKGPTNYRIFLYHLLKEVPQLKKDFYYPKIGLRILKQLPMLFFGGEGSKVFMHYDIDYANILHFHFHGTKRCLLFPPKETPNLYKVPYALIAREDIDFREPDYNRFPALRHARGFHTQLVHGEALYMPEGYWHQMTYLSPGFSMSFRAAPRSFVHFSRAVYNLILMRHFDNWMRKLKGEKWIRYKNDQAVVRTHKRAGIKTE